MNRNLRFYNDCIGINKPDRLLHADPPPYAPNVQNQTVDYGGITWKGNPGTGWSAVNTTGNVASDPMALVKQAQEYQVQQNQPAIKTLQTQYNPDTGTGSLVDKYSALIDSITAAEEPALNATTTATNNELGRRGISGDSGVAQNQIASALLPVTTQFGQLKANTGLGEQQDLSQIAGNIANLQAGNVGNALSFSGNISSAQAAIQAAILANQKPQVLTSGQTLIDPATGRVIASGPSINTGSSGGSGSGGNVVSTGNQVNTGAPAANIAANAGIKLNNPSSYTSTPSVTSPGYVNPASLSGVGLGGLILNLNNGVGSGNSASSGNSPLRLY